MEELKKLNKIIQKFVPDGPHELLMVIDATTGQNALLQARQFAADIGLTGVIITKLDGTAKGGLPSQLLTTLGYQLSLLGQVKRLKTWLPSIQRVCHALFDEE